MLERIRLINVSITLQYKGIPAQLYEVDFYSSTIHEHYEQQTPYDVMLNELVVFARQKLAESNNVGNTLLEMVYRNQKIELMSIEGSPIFNYPVVQVWARTDGIKNIN